ncbi:aminotransferase class I/II-fold pyridoxal phosphate-dependent enzyme [Streptomyces sp. TRM72054]|uniref:serine hydroxymethyltransferase n=1 Tax=Streptomyces sp. TRM72054 TaxID=2870562 RepID=UPI0027E11361|nr:aminotransferase class I/II-fold pyridoxal phosphate-dependent enzyme [Streptomyces sp. TRM72054]
MISNVGDCVEQPLAEVDPEVSSAIGAELHRQQSTLEMIASENFAPTAVPEAQRSVLTNKYAGYPGRRYYGGCEHIDAIEQLAIARVKELFDAEHANVQTHSGAQANAAAMFALLDPGDPILSVDLAHGGPLTHRMRINYSRRLYNVAPYHVGESDLRVDMDEVESLAHKARPRLIVTGWSAYPQPLDFAAFRRIADEVGALLMVDMVHFAGLMAAGLHPSPVPLRRRRDQDDPQNPRWPARRQILSRAGLAKKINSAVLPGQQSGPLEHVIAAKAAASEAFREHQQRTAPAFSRDAALATMPPRPGSPCSPGDRGPPGPGRPARLAARRAAGRGPAPQHRHYGPQRRVPFDPRPPMISSCLRIGTPALATRGFGADEFREVADIIALTLREDLDPERAASLRGRVTALADKTPLYARLNGAAG